MGRNGITGGGKALRRLDGGIQRKGERLALERGQDTLHDTGWEPQSVGVNESDSVDLVMGIKVHSWPVASLFLRALKQGY